MTPLCLQPMQCTTIHIEALLLRRGTASPGRRESSRPRASPMPAMLTSWPLRAPRQC